MKRSSGVEVALEQPKVPYRETIRAEIRIDVPAQEADGGAGQFAEVHLRIEPLPGEEASSSRARSSALDLPQLLALDREGGSAR